VLQQRAKVSKRPKQLEVNNPTAKPENRKPNNSQNQLRNKGIGDLPKFKDGLRQVPDQSRTILEPPLKYSTSKSNPVLTMLVSNLPMNHIGDPSSSVLLSIPADHSHHGNRIKTYNPAVINGEDNLDAAIKPPLLEIDIRVPRPEGDKASPVTNPGGQENLISLAIALLRKPINIGLH